MNILLESARRSETPPKSLGAIWKAPGLSVLPLSLDGCVAAAELLQIHDDPFDRFIIAGAKPNGWEVVTADGRFEE